MSGPPTRTRDRELEIARALLRRALLRLSELEQRVTLLELELLEKVEEPGSPT